MKEIEAVIGLDGQVSIDLIGYRGKGCADIAEKLAKALGKTVKTDKKCEFYQAEVKDEVRIKH